jgi:hypothetical protein
VAEASGDAVALGDGELVTVTVGKMDVGGVAVGDGEGDAVN